MSGYRVVYTVKGNEVGRNDVQFGAGYSELDGFFVQGKFNTRNFLGRGNTVGVSLQVGRQSFEVSYIRALRQENQLAARRVGRRGSKHGNQPPRMPGHSLIQ